MRTCLLLLAWLLVRSAFGGDALALWGESVTASFSATDGAILSLAQKGNPGAILKSGEYGLWQVRFQDGTVLNAADFSAGTPDRLFKNELLDSAGRALRFHYSSADIHVTVTITGRDNALSFAAQVTPQKKAILSFSLPARLRFDPAQLQRFVCPMNGNFSVGAAFMPQFFKEQSVERPSAWRPARTASGPAGYAALYGGPLDQRADHGAPVALQCTADGRTWLGESLAKRVDGAKAVVNRPPTRAQAELLLVDSPNGPYLSANRLGGKGNLWRIGGGVGDQERDLVADVVTAVAARVAAGRRDSQSRPCTVGLIALSQGPASGGWAGVQVRTWAERLSRLPAAETAPVFRTLETPRDLEEALSADKFSLILNPYGEWLPALPGKDLAATVQAIGRFVRAGGNWCEVGGYSFFYELQPVRYFTYSVPYPPAFADFFHLQTQAGSAALWGVQPQKWPPWEGAKNRDAIFVPGNLSCGADERGGYCERAFGTHVSAGESWTAPLVRLSAGKSAADELLAYCAANEIKRGLPEKVAPDTLRKLKESVLVYYAGTAREKLAHLNLLPVPSLIHFADYLHGDFDKQYPDHLPPHPDFGSPVEFRAFFDRAHELGHLVSPYTNPTWWCDGPKGPTFEREGTAPLLKGLDGKPVHERYEANEGWTVCHWHPAVQAANRETVRRFIADYPVDVLFQDQCGARTWAYDTNPASPTRYAYADGLVSMVAEDCQRKPLGTEAGWDRVVNYETQLCGLSYRIVPTEHTPSWLQPMKSEYPPATWEVFPLAQYIAHDKTMLLHHDLGQFVTNRQVLAWTLGLGFSLSYRVAAAELTRDAQREWLKWLDRLQKSVCARYIGQPVTAFEHDRGAAPTVDDDGVMRATYGPVKLVANLGPVARTEGATEMPAFGFLADAPGMAAVNAKKMDGLPDCGAEGLSYVLEYDAARADVWIYAAGHSEVHVLFPDALQALRNRKIRVVLDGGAEQQVFAAGGISLRLPARDTGKRVTPPPELGGLAPRYWPGAKPAIGVLDLSGCPSAWTKVAPGDWVAAFGRSRLAKEFGVPVQRIATTEELIAALQAGPTAWLAIVNPYGECFPAAAPGKWRDMLELIRGYVAHGGSWWETGGYSLHRACSLRNGAWEGEPVGPAGLALLGVPVGGGAVDQAPEPLRVPAEGRAWLGDELSATIEKSASSVNRGLPGGTQAEGHVALVSGGACDFIGGYRLGGWGWLWRIGGFNPNPDVALSAAIGATEYLYTHPPPPVKPSATKYLWHATLTAAE